jgi:hypothetical protein
MQQQLDASAPAAQSSLGELVEQQLAATGASSVIGPTGNCDAGIGSIGRTREQRVSTPELPGRGRQRDRLAVVMRALRHRRRWRRACRNADHGICIAQSAGILLKNPDSWPQRARPEPDVLRLFKHSAIVKGASFAASVFVLPGL